MFLGLSPLTISLASATSREKFLPNIFEILQSFARCELVGWIAEHGCCAAGVAIGVDEGFAFDAIVAFPIDCKGSFGFFDVERFGVALAGEPECQVIVAIDDPGVAGFAGEQRELTDRDDAPIVVGRAAGDIADLVGKTKTRALDHALAWSAFTC